MRQFNIIFFIGLLILFSASPIVAQQKTIIGTVVDSISNDPIAFASIYIIDSKTNIIANNNGEFEISIPKQNTRANVSSIGYHKKSVILNANDTCPLIIKMRQEEVMLDEVIVLRKKSKYSKKNNPAVAFVNKIRTLQDITDPYRNEFYNYDKYEKITLGLNNFTDNSQNQQMFKDFQFLNNYIDTSEISAKPILNVSMNEKASQVIYPQKQKKNL